MHSIQTFGPHILPGNGPIYRTVGIGQRLFINHSKGSSSAGQTIETTIAGHEGWRFAAGW